MSRWAQGADVIDALFKDRHLQRVVTATETAETLLAAAARHVESAHRNADDPSSALSRRTVVPPPLA